MNFGTAWFDYLLKSGIIQLCRNRSPERIEFETQEFFSSRLLDSRPPLDSILPKCKLNSFSLLPSARKAGQSICQVGPWRPNSLPQSTREWMSNTLPTWSHEDLYRFVSYPRITSVGNIQSWCPRPLGLKESRTISGPVVLEPHCWQWCGWEATCLVLNLLSETESFLDGKLKISWLWFSR
ncbi:hypothetical protein RRG08_033194 [Elysia crispata]|uniref:Uncharacterized protein n=1 Tax=Elysia crispata TaxID=231223 RepID=A0AAE1BAI2_9GAST|nr:hypothetical protein RRG08_033194 [Elysia crispata]